MIGPRFAEELAAAGLAGLPVAWRPGGEITGRENLTAEQNAALDAVIAAHDPQQAAPAEFVARRFIALLTSDDYAAIQAAIAASPALGLLWTALQAQGDAPISTASSRFQQGWAGLSAALGETRAGEIAAALGID